MDSNPDFELDERTKPLDTFVVKEDGGQRLYVKYNGTTTQFEAFVPEEKKEDGCTFAECLIQMGYDFYIGSDEKPSPFVLPKGIAKGTTIDEFNSLFNIKENTSRNSDNCITYEYVKGDDFTHILQVQVSKETKEIQSISYLYMN